MSDSPMLSKMDALLKKHRGGGDNQPQTAPEAPVATAHPDATELEIESAASPPAGAWLPVLTQIIERGTPPPARLSAPATPAVDSPPVDSPPVISAAETTLEPAEDRTPPAEAPAVDASDALTAQLMSELAPRLSEVMEQQVASELRKNLDQTVTTLLSQLDVNMREIVRNAVAEKLKQPRDPST